MALDISDIIQKLIKQLKETACDPEKQKKIEAQYPYLSPISLETFGFLNEKDQCTVAILVGKIYSPNSLSAEEETELQVLIRCAEEKQREAYHSKGLELITVGNCTLISLKTFESLDAQCRDALAVLIGRQAARGGLPEKDERSMNNLIQLAKLKQAKIASVPAAFLSASENRNIPPSQVPSSRTLSKKSE